MLYQLLSCFSNPYFSQFLDSDCKSKLIQRICRLPTSHRGVFIVLRVEYIFCNLFGYLDIWIDEIFTVLLWNVTRSVKSMLYQAYLKLALGVCIEGDTLHICQYKQEIAQPRWIPYCC
ncbi:MAG: hypothetical protein KatS3mg016_0460 [Fimbriimonadales bacterium]|nr:MAG: hypothetical protein KatS3mg016_0460 [Fimbriimonadales bacterium]